jgi:hypothetical protein
MIWLFSRRKQEIRLETWYDKHTSEFVVDIVHPEGQCDSKRFVNDSVYRTWLAAWDEKLVAQGWTQSGPFLSVPARPEAPPADASAVTNPEAVATGTATRTYASAGRVFEVALSRLEVRSLTLWTVERVTETSRDGRPVSVPGLYAIASPSPEAAFARACEGIDKWLLTQPGSS